MGIILCELCGCNDIRKQNGLYVCQKCGAKYSVEEAKKLVVTGEGEAAAASSDITVDSEYPNRKKKTNSVKIHNAKRRKPWKIIVVLGALLVLGVIVAILAINMVVPKERLDAAIGYFKSGRWYDAKNAFSGLGSIQNINVGDTIYFGNFEQDNDSSNGNERIEWRVLKKQDDKILVISDCALTTKQFDSYETRVSDWAECDLREWLNNDFYYQSFSDVERSLIVEVSLPNDYTGDSTYDKVFLLSEGEAIDCFESFGRKCKPSESMIKSGYKTANGYCCWWWLRSPALDRSLTMLVMPDGELYREGYFPYIYEGVRPAMWLRGLTIDATKDDLMTDSVASPEPDVVATTTNAPKPSPTPLPVVPINQIDSKMYNTNGEFIFSMDQLCELIDAGIRDLCPELCAVRITSGVENSRGHLVNKIGITEVLYFFESEDSVARITGKDRKGGPADGSDNKISRIVENVSLVNPEYAQAALLTLIQSCNATVDANHNADIMMKLLQGLETNGSHKLTDNGLSYCVYMNPLFDDHMVLEICVDGFE